MLLYPLGRIGGPALNPVMHRPHGVRSSGCFGFDSAVISASMRFRVSDVTGGSRPSNGSETSDVRLSVRFAADSIQKLLYEPVSPGGGWRSPALCCTLTRCSSSLSLSTALSPNSVGRSSGVEEAKL